MSTDDKALSLRTYRAVTEWLRPVASLVLQRRLKNGKEDPDRITEREGFPSKPRPAGPVIWVHGASVGESLSALPLISRLTEQYLNATVLVTTGTITSSALMAERLPPRALHQFVPLDQPGFVRRFLDHWQPNAVLFVESELWPVMLGELAEREIPAALVNGRLSPRSFSNWSKRPNAAFELLSTFEVILGQDAANAERLSVLARRPALTLGNLKRAAPPLPHDAAREAELRGEIAGRPVWLAASTHMGEEELIWEAHQTIAQELPNVLTIIAPRHPERGPAVEALLQARGSKTARRTAGEKITAETNFYIADTLGELGLFYRASEVAFIGGSLLEIGGHNPMEPARLGSAIVTGPHVFNFAETFNEMRHAGGLALVRNERDLGAGVQRLLLDAHTRNAMSVEAKKWADIGGQKVLDDILSALDPILEKGMAT